MAHDRRLDRIRVGVAALSCLSIAGGLVWLSSQGPEGPRSDELVFLILFILFSAFPSLLYLNLVRSRTGVIVGGSALLAGSILPTITLLAGGVDDGLEVFYIPVFAWVGGLAAVAMDSFIRFAPRTSRRSPGR